MRKNTSEVVNALIAKSKKHAPHKGNGSPVWTDGRSIFSYYEPIIAPDPCNPDGYVVTNQKFSYTTTVQTNGASFYLSHYHGKEVREADHSVVKASANS